MDTNTYPAELHSLPPKRLWYGFAAAPLAWALQGLIGVVVSSEVCPADAPGWQILGQAGVRLVLALFTAGLLAVAVSAGLTSYKSWTTRAGGRQFSSAQGVSREAFMALGGVLISTIFTLGILWAGVPIVMLQVCERGR